MKLVGSEVEIAIVRHRKCVRPQDARIVGDRDPFAIDLSLPNTVALVVACVNVTLVIRLKTVGSTFFAEIFHCFRDVPVVNRPISEQSRRDRKEMATGKGTEEQSFAIR